MLITNLGVFSFDSESGELCLDEIHSGIDQKEVEASIGWNLRVALEVAETPEPTDHELQIIRKELDPDHLYI